MIGFEEGEQCEHIFDDGYGIGDIRCERLKGHDGNHYGVVRWSVSS